MFRRLALVTLLLTAACGPAGTVAEIDVVQQAVKCGAGLSPATPGFGPEIDAYAKYEGQTSCTSVESSGAKAFRDLILSTYSCTASGGITRSCSSGGKSEHKEGRAWDWMLDAPHPAADAMIDWLLATDEHGNKHAMARRLGVMYIIWNKKTWKAYKASAGWTSYTGGSPHTDHVHVSFSWAGARQETSFWTAAVTPEPEPVPEPEPGQCTPRCEDSTAVAANCASEDCAAKNQTCAVGALGASCVEPTCAPAAGTLLVAHDVCLDSHSVGSCDGLGHLAAQRACPAETVCVQSTVGGICERIAPPSEEDGPGIEPDPGSVTSDPRPAPAPMSETDHAGPGGQLYGASCAVGAATAPPWPLMLLLSLLLAGRRRR